MIKSFFAVCTMAIVLLNAIQTEAQPVHMMNTGEMVQAFNRLNKLGTVLYVAAHPDDENTRLLSYLANERQFRTVYLSITRGDGGQNLIGNEQGEELGMIRTRELMAARSIDGAEQFFTRANDFGFSKNPEETFNFWNKENILADVVFAIRKFQPDVIINRFPTTGEGGHGHHTASAILAIEAFKAAADPKRFPEQLAYVSTWQAKRIFQNFFVPRGQPTPDQSAMLKVDVGGYNPLLGISYGEMAADSRSMHKSQGFGVARTRGTQVEYFKKLDGDTAVTDLFQGIDTSWQRVGGSASIQSKIDAVSRSFNPRNPVASLPLLSELLTLVKSSSDPYWSEVKSREIVELIKQCSGLFLDANARAHFASPGDTMTFTISAMARLATNVRLKRVMIGGIDTIPGYDLVLNTPFVFNKVFTIPSNSQLVQPYWLTSPHSTGSYAMQDLSIAGAPWNKPDPEAIFELEIGGFPVEIRIPVTHKETDPVLGERYSQMEILPAVSIIPSEELLLFTGGPDKSLTITVEAHTHFPGGLLEFGMPAGWVVTPNQVEVHEMAVGARAATNVIITPPPGATTSNQMQFLNLYVRDGKTTYNKYVKRINHDHIPSLVHLRDSKIKLVTADIKTVTKKIGYIKGAGDDVAECLIQAGFEIEFITPEQAENSDLSKFEAIVTGIRAYNTIENPDRIHANLMRFVTNGGNLVVQYNTNNFLGSVTAKIGPYPFKITRDRVTNESAQVFFTDPNHFLLNKPNKLSTADFADWVQERGLYFAGEWDSLYQTPISWNDSTEQPMKGGLIVAKKGNGYFIYTGISFFRQLPAGVPGAYRLFSNLVNAGREMSEGSGKSEGKGKKNK